MNHGRKRHKVHWLRASVIIIFALAASVSAASLEEYRDRVDRAAERAFAVEQMLEGGEVNDSLSKEFVGRIRRDFPGSERIDWSGGSADVSNDWLLAQVSEFENETDLRKKLPIAAAIREYLSAQAFKLYEEEHTDAAARTKDEDKQKLAEILRRPEYQKPEAAKESAFRRWIREFFEWLASIWPKPAAPAEGLSGLTSLASILRILLYAGLAVAAGFLIFKIVPLLVPRLKRNKKRKPKSRVILGEQIGDDQTAADLFGAAEQLAREGDLRGAIRKGYIALLCDLADRRIIGLAMNKTNRDYLRDVRARRELHPRLQSVTDIFERHWYGFQRSDEEDWRRFSKEYDETIRSA